MRRYAAVLATDDCPLSDIERCRIARVSLRRLRLWRRGSHFQQWVNDELYSVAGLAAARLWQDLIVQARKGDRHAAKLVTERFSALTARAKSKMTQDLAKFR